MGLLSRMIGFRRRRQVAAADPFATNGKLHACQVEKLENRCLMAGDVHIGMTYFEPNDGDDVVGNTFEVTWNGGAPGTQLTQLTIDTDKAGNGDVGLGDTFFNTAAGGIGVFGSTPFTVVSQGGVASVTPEVVNGGSKLVLNFTGFDAGEKLIFKIDVDEMGFIHANAVAEGAEFEGSKLTAVFNAPHYQSASDTDIFLDAFDSKFAGLGFDLPPDNYQPPATVASPIYTAGAALTLTQEPLPVKISGTVYDDQNANNHQDGGDAGIAGVTLELWRDDGDGYVKTNLTTTTDANGHYLFDVAKPGKFQVREAQPSTYLSVGATAGTVNGVTEGVVTTVDEISDIDILGGDEGVHYDFAEARPATLSGHVYHDANNNGLLNPGEVGIGGVTLSVQYLPAIGPLPAAITVTTAADGSWSATGLMPGNYQVTEQQPASWLDGLDHPGTASGTAHNPGDLIDGIVLTSGKLGENYDFGELAPSSIQGMVYADRNNDCLFQEGEPPIAGVTVYLFDATGAKVATTTTDSDGQYAFNDLAPGKYTVREVQPNGYFQGGQMAGSAGGDASTDQIANITLVSGTHATDYDFCEQEPVSLAGYVYVDQNENGVFDAGEAPLAGVVLRLLGANGAPTGETTTTAEDGSYHFDGLAPGVYGVAEDQPDNYYDGLDTAGSAGGVALNPGDTITDVVLDPSVHATDYNFGELVPASLSGMVHADRNGDCIWQEGEPLLSGVTIYLLDASGHRIANTTTDENGEYMFTHLAPGEVYGVEEIQPDGYFQGMANHGSAGGSEQSPDIIVGIVLSSGEAATDYNFCEEMPASIEGTVHADRNGDCIWQPGEPLVAGATIYLLDAQGQRIAGKQTLTDQNGHYAFTMLQPGTYGVEEVLPAGYFVHEAEHGTNGGSEPSGDKIVGAVLGSGDAATDYDFCVDEPATISGVVYSDLNQNCQQDAEEPGIAGVTITLLDANGIATAITTTTGADGSYAFTGLKPGTYGVAETQPTDYFNGCADPGTAGGTPDDPVDTIRGVVLATAVHATGYNFGEIPPGKISGYVFKDGPTIVLPNGTSFDVTQYRDGKRTPDDTPLAGIVLLLGRLDGQAVRDASGQPVKTVTDASGHYEFSGLAPDYYTVFEVQPSGYITGLNSPGTTGGVVYQANRGIRPQFLTTAQTDNAIARIYVTPNANSVENDFSHALVMPPPPVTQNPPPNFGFIPVISPAPPPGPAAIGPGYAPPAPSILPNAPPIVQNTNYFGGVGTIDSYTWHLSVIDGGSPRGEPATSGPLARRVSSRPGDEAWLKNPMNEGQWSLYSADGKVIRQVVFGRRNGKPITGDFNGDGITDVGIFVDGRWFIDLNGNGEWDETDLWAELGGPDDLPVTGDWDGDGKTDIAIFGPSWQGDARAIAAEPGLPDPGNRQRGVPKNLPPQPSQATNGVRTMRRTAVGQVRTDLIDHVFRHGVAGDVPLSGDWNGDGVHTIGLFSGGVWYQDVDGDGKFTSADQKFEYGLPNDIPVVGDFDGDGTSDVGVYRQGVWYIDSDHNRRFDAHDRAFELGGLQDQPVVGDWDGDGRDEPATYQETDTPPDTKAAA